MKHELITSADAELARARELRLKRARKFGDRCGGLLYHCPCAARLVARGFTLPDILAFRARFGDAKRAQGELVLMECGHSCLSACCAAAANLQLTRE